MQFSGGLELPRVSSVLCDNLSAAREELVQRFHEVTGKSCSDEIACDLLRNSSWSLEGAVDHYFNFMLACPPPLKTPLPTSPSLPGSPLAHSSPQGQVDRTYSTLDKSAPLDSNLGSMTMLSRGSVNRVNSSSSSGSSSSSNRSSKDRQDKDSPLPRTCMKKVATAMSTFDPKRLEALFRYYQDTPPHPDLHYSSCLSQGKSVKITPDGIQQLCEDLGIDGCDPVLLVFAYLCRCEDQGFFTKEEFIRGMTAIHADSVAKLKSKLPDLQSMLNDLQELKPVYSYAFTFALEKGKRHLPVDLAVEYLRLLLKNHFSLLEEWIKFMFEYEKKKRLESCDHRVDDDSVYTSLEIFPRDLWMMLFDFCVSCKPDLSDYDMDGAWPVLIDEFVEWHRRNVPKPEPMEKDASMKEDG